MPRAGLTRDTVVATAAELADEHGLAALTLAAVAARHGVRLPSLYNHVASLDDLRSALATRSIRELGAALATAASGRSGTDALGAVADAYRAFALTAPGRYEASLRPTALYDEEQAAAASDVLEAVYSVLDGYGLVGDARIDAARAVRAALHGWADLERGGGFGLPRDVEASFHRMVEQFDTALRTPA